MGYPLGEVLKEEWGGERGVPMGGGDGSRRGGGDGLGQKVLMIIELHGYMI